MVGIAREDGRERPYVARTILPTTNARQRAFAHPTNDHGQCHLSTATTASGSGSSEATTAITKATADRRDRSRLTLRIADIPMYRRKCSAPNVARIYFERNPGPATQPAALI